jgi:molybdate/tungstate transport system substrate-binding protein
LRWQRKGISKTAAVVVVVAILVVALAAYLAWGALQPAKTNGSTTGSASPLISFSADAYTPEATALLTAFSQSAGIPVAPVKSGGSFADANQIAAGAPDDVFISVALSATASSYLKNDSANWAIGFASDEMVIAYSNATAGAGVVSLGKAAASSNSTSDWNSFFNALTSGGVKVGISNPVSDPAGLRGWFVLEAAGYLYAGGNSAEYSGALVTNGGNVTGTNAAALVAPLQSGQIQFLFLYKSAAVADHLGYILLDRHINLGDPTLGGFYSEFTYTDSAGKSAGSPIILCITVPLSSVNTSEALQFVQYVVRNSGTLSAYGLQPFSPAKLYSNTTPPPAVNDLVTEGLVTQAGSLP